MVRTLPAFIGLRSVLCFSVLEKENDFPSYESSEEDGKGNIQHNTRNFPVQRPTFNRIVNFDHRTVSNSIKVPLGSIAKIFW